MGLKWWGHVVWYKVTSVQGTACIESRFPTERDLGTSLGCNRLWLCAVRILPPRVAVRIEREC